MYDLALGAIDKIIDLLKIRERRLQKRFEQMWSPAYDDLQSVHDDYYSIFLGVDRLIDPRFPEAEWSQRREEAIRFLKEKRLLFEARRQKIRALSEVKVDLSITNTLIESENTFLSEILHYFECGSPFESHTFSISLLDALEDTTENNCDVAQIGRCQTAIKNRIIQLSNNWIEVSRAFRRLQMAVIQTAT